MNNYSKIISVLAVATLFVSASAAELKADQEVIQSSSSDVQQGAVGDTTFLSQLQDSLSLTASSTQVGPGDTITLDAEVSATYPASDLTNLRKIVEFYRCNDDDCSDPNTYLEADSQVANVDSWASGLEKTWTVEYTVPSETAKYEAVAYIYDTETKQRVSTDSVEQFEVVPASFPDTGDDGSNDNQDSSYPDTGDDNSNSDEGSDTLDIDNQLGTTPFFNVDQEENSVTGTVIISNFGSDDMLQSDIVEMQVNSGGEVLSFTGNQETCDPSNPTNVHKDYSIDSKDSQNIKLTVDDLEEGQEYDVFFVTRDGCSDEVSTDPETYHVEPIENSVDAGSFTLDGGSQDDNSLDDGDQVTDRQVQNVDPVGKPKVSVEDGTVKATVTLKNRGGAMPDADLLEMQVRPQGLNELSFSTTQDVCNPNTPENVNRDYELGSGEKASTTLSTSAVEEGQKYTVYLITRQSCADEHSPSDGDYRVGPFSNGIRAGTVDLTSDNGSVSLPGGNLIQILLLVAGLIFVAGGAYLSLK